MKSESRGQPSLTAGEAEVRMLLENVPARVALLDRDRRHWYVNQEYARFVGRPAEEILGRTVAEVAGTTPHVELLPLGDKALAGEVVSWEGWMPHHLTDEALFVQRFYLPYRGPSGSIDGYFILTRDLTELKKGEQRLAEQLAELRASQALAAAITAAALDCVIVIDETGHVVSFNPSAEATFGYPSEAAIGRSVAELIIPPEHRAAHAASLLRYRTTGEARWLGRRVEMTAMRSDGSTIPCELSVQEVTLPERRLFATYLRDLTAQKEAEAQIRRQRDALHESEKFAAFGSLLAGVAHEINNPLSIVIGHAVLLEEEARDAGNTALAGRAERIRIAAERCGKTISTFLSMAGHRGVRNETIEPSALVLFAIDVLGEDLNPDVELVGIFRPSSRRYRGRGSVASRAGESHHERLAGARRFGIRAAHSVAARASGPMLEISVDDNGPGVPEEIQGRIFDPFFTTKKAGAGTGIGLAVARGIAEAHGGSLTIAASAEGGACFVLSLPFAT